jgi:hypothetical protein
MPSAISSDHLAMRRARVGRWTSKEHVAEDDRVPRLLLWCDRSLTLSIHKISNNCLLARSIQLSKAKIKTKTNDHAIIKCD